MGNSVACSLWQVAAGIYLALVNDSPKQCRMGQLVYNTGDFAEVRTRKENNGENEMGKPRSETPCKRERQQEPGKVGKEV